jgi:hypothetical protein
MNTNFEKIKLSIRESPLSLPDQISLLDLFVIVNDDDLKDVADLFFEDPSWVEKINENYKAKKSALSTKDPEAWKKILETEEEQLKNIETE